MNKAIQIPDRPIRIIQVGAGGNGGYLAQRLSKMIRSFIAADIMPNYSYQIIDGDKFEEKNLLRQPCIEEDVGFYKSQVLSSRYGSVYDIPITYRESYLENVDDLISIGQSWSPKDIVILIGCVDNHATRKIMHDYFYATPHNIIYLDSGVDSADLSDEDSGYGGMITCGMKVDGEVLLLPVADLFPEILDGDGADHPTASCGDVAPSLPQRMQTNEMAAIIMAGYLNTILGSKKIHSHFTNFNAKYMVSKPEYIR